MILATLWALFVVFVPPLAEALLHIGRRALSDDSDHVLEVTALHRLVYLGVALYLALGWRGEQRAYLGELERAEWCIETAGAHLGDVERRFDALFTHYQQAIGRSSPARAEAEVDTP